MEKVWLVEEFARWDDDNRSKCVAKGFYSSKVKALAAIHHDIADIVEDKTCFDPNIIYEEDLEGVTATVSVRGGPYGLYDWYYVITAQNTDLAFSQYR